MPPTLSSRPRSPKAALAAIVVALAAASLPAPATGQSSPYVDWPALLPPFPAGGHRPSTERDCRDGDRRCIDETIFEMKRRLNAVVPVCDHQAVFSLAYLRVTEDVRDAINSNLFDDPHWLGHEDKVFGRLYFDAYDAWVAGRRERTPVAWQLAFGAAEQREVSALGNFLMSMNAHINRDFPFMLAGIGIVTPDGRSRKPDHDAYNRRLAALYQPVLAEVAQRFDPTADDNELGLIDDELAYFILQSWREGVWRNAERLVNSGSPAEREQVAQSIEQEAELIGEQLLAAYRYSDPAQARTRDAWCAVHGGQDPVAWRPAAATLVLRRGTVAVGRDRTARLRLSCPRPSLGCSGKATIVAGRRSLGSRSYELSAGQSRTLRLRLKRRLGARARSPGGLQVTVRLSRAGVVGQPGVATWRARLRR